MKILHTSDWHLGHRLHEQSQYDEQLRFLNWLNGIISEQNIDVLLISGDVFDTGVPSTQSQKLYYDFLVQLQQTPCQQIIITGGNHDAPGTINAPKELLNALSIKVVGKACEQIEDEVFNIEINHEKLIVAAVPYLRDQDIRRALAGETFEQLSDRYKTALVNHYNKVANYCNTINTQKSPVIAMGHLFAIGGSTTESEQSIYVGNLGDIGADDFPALFNYIALGHLHRAQRVNQLDHIRYSGSPCILSFSEVNQTKKVIVLETHSGKIDRIEEVNVPPFRIIRSIKGTVDDCIIQLQAIHNESHELTPWIEVILDNTNKDSVGYAEINKAAESLNLEVLKVSYKNERKMAGLEKLIENAQHIKELSPTTVFKLKCKELQFDIDSHPEMMDAFNEVLQIVQEG